jgi:glutathione synthase/RimK-type ligase-like ATP-grasp enzyme
VPQQIALFANPGSEQLNEIAEAVTEAGGRPILFDIQLGGARANTVAITDDTAFWNGTDFRDIRAMHLRGIEPRTLPALPAVMNERFHAEYRAEFLREQEFQAATVSFFESEAARGKLVINRLVGAYVDHNSKSQFYEKIRAAGFPAPRSLSTNDPLEAARFIDEVGEAIVKPAVGIGSTRLITEPDKKRLDELAACPCLIQERVVGPTVRVHIVADTVVLCLKILSEGGVDSRTETKGFEYIKLADEEEDRIVRANRFLGLHYAAWDVILTPTGRVVYLDCNIGPYVMWIGPEFRRAVFRQLATYLVGFAETGSLDEASGRVRPHRPHQGRRPRSTH